MTEKTTFAAGCFWGIEAAFRKIKGVINVTVGYTGGQTKNPTYEDVCSHSTGHVEAAQVEFDPNIVSYDELLDAFWNMHNPTTKNRQGPDIGSQYRSVIFFHSPDQEKIALASKLKLEQSGKFDKPIVTEITKASEFYQAEEYHQRYFEKHGLQSCHI